MRGHLSGTHFYNERLFLFANPVEPRLILSSYSYQGISPYTKGILLKDDLKGLPLTLRTYSNIRKDQPYARGKLCGWMIEGCDDDL